MNCELCGKRINEYGKYKAVIGKMEVNLCKGWRKESKNTTAECSVKRTETIWTNYEYDDYSANVKIEWREITDGQLLEI